MRCDRFAERLQEALDDRRSPGKDRELVRHAAACGECRSMLTAAERMTVVFAPARLREGRGRRWSWRAAASSSAAATAAVVALLLVRLTISQRPEWKESAAWAPRAVEQVGARDDSGELHGRRERRLGRGGDLIMLGARGRSSGAAVKGPGEHVIGGAAEAPRRISLAMTGGALRPTGGASQREALEGRAAEPLAEIVTVLGESWSSLRQVKMEEVSEVAEGFRPLTQSVGTVMEALRGTLRGAKRERMERSPDTSRVAGEGWFA